MLTTRTAWRLLRRDEPLAKPLDLGRTSLGYLDDNFARGRDASGAPVSAWDYDALAGAGLVGGLDLHVVRAASEAISAIKIPWMSRLPTCSTSSPRCSSQGLPS